MYVSKPGWGRVNTSNGYYESCLLAHRTAHVEFVASTKQRVWLLAVCASNLFAKQIKKIWVQPTWREICPTTRCLTVWVVRVWIYFFLQSLCYIMLQAFTAFQLILGDLIVLGVQLSSPQSFEIVVDSLARWTHNDTVKSFHLSIVCFHRLCLDPAYGNYSQLCCQVAQYTSDRSNSEGSLDFYLQLRLPWPLYLLTVCSPLSHFSITFLITL